MKFSKLNTHKISISAFFVLLAVLSRLISHPFHFTALLAVGFAFSLLFAESVIYASFISLLAMVISDALMGYPLSGGFVYLAVLLSFVPFFLNKAEVTQKTSLNQVAQLAKIVSGSLVFYFVSNFGVWFEGVLYPQTMNGLITCLQMGVPFYKNQFMADLFLTSVLYVVTAQVMSFLKSKSANSLSAENDRPM